MKILPVSILKVNNFQAQRKMFSNYAQTFMKSQIMSAMFNLERIYNNVDYKVFSQNQGLMHELGIKWFGRSKKVGITFYGNDYTYRVSQPESDLLKLDLYDKKRKNLLHSALFAKNNNEYCYAGIFSKDKTEEMLGEILDDADARLLTIKRKYASVEKSRLTLDELTSEKIAYLNNMLQMVPRDSGIKNCGYINEQCQKIVQSVSKKTDAIKILYKKIPNETSRFNVRSYYKNYDTKQTYKNLFAFKNIGPKGETLLFYNNSYKNNPYIVLKVLAKNGEETNFVISKEGKVQRNFPYRISFYKNFKERKDAIPDYLTQQEIDDSNLIKYLKCLNKELGLFKVHISNWLKTQSDFKKKHVNKNVATLDVYKEVLENISDGFQKYKKNIVKYFYKMDERRRFKTDNNISTELSTSSVTIKNATSKGFDIRLSYPIIPNNVATQILVLDGERVDKSFYILDNKLLKFDIKKKSDRFIHYDRNMYFHDKNYLNKSELDKYLEILQTKFKEINEKLDSHISKRNRK